LGKAVIIIFFVIGFIIFSIIKYAGQGMRAAYRAVNEPDDTRRNLPNRGKTSILDIDRSSTASRVITSHSNPRAHLPNSDRPSILNVKTKPAPRQTKFEEYTEKLLQIEKNLSMETSAPGVDNSEFDVEFLSDMDNGVIAAIEEQFIRDVTPKHWKWTGKRPKSEFISGYIFGFCNTVITFILNKQGDVLEEHRTQFIESTFITFFGDVDGGELFEEILTLDGIEESQFGTEVFGRTLNFIKNNPGEEDSMPSFLIGSMDGFEWLQNVNLMNTKPGDDPWELNGRSSKRPFALIAGGQKPSRLFKYLEKNPKG
jgi:hypothetical protein